MSEERIQRWLLIGILLALTASVAFGSRGGFSKQDVLTSEQIGEEHAQIQSIFALLRDNKGRAPAEFMGK